MNSYNYSTVRRLVTKKVVKEEINAIDLASRLSAENINSAAAEDLLGESDSTLVKLVHKIIFDAVLQKASDIHFESSANQKDFRVRFRKDGILQHYLSIPDRFRGAIVSRLKIMSQLDITERRKPQDGKIDFNRYGAVDIELRVAVIPTRDGLEDVVIRLLTNTAAVSLDYLGLDRKTLETLRGIICKPQGLFIVCGPTGSGKTTTLHSVLAHLNEGETKIWTAEDPIEITQPGLCQVQVNSKIGWTFAAALRSFLRADPDVIMVGEMRDLETAKIGIEASLTGHLVLSTLHTNSAAESIVRLLDWGLDPFSLSDAFIGILSQRLARKFCEFCRVSYEPEKEELEKMAEEYCAGTDEDHRAKIVEWRQKYSSANGRISLWRAKGCESCDHRGYSGRMGIYELLSADEGVKALIQKRAVSSYIKTTAISLGMRTLKQDGIDKVLLGLTDMHQIHAACG
jgi:type II secretory ATPase GspE/PulE/Tfp pilus assembly ATPase PilB-like protein